MSQNKIRPVIKSASPFKHPYSERDRKAIQFAKDSRWTKQSPKDACDINTIMARYRNTGVLPEFVSKVMPQYLDVTGEEFQAHMDLVIEAQAVFNALPSDVRSRFANNPALFLDFTSNPNNRAEMDAMGLLKPQEQWADYVQPSPSPASDKTV